MLSWHCILDHSFSTLPNIDLPHFMATPSTAFDPTKEEPGDGTDIWNWLMHGCRGRKGGGEFGIEGQGRDLKWSLLLIRLSMGESKRQRERERERWEEQGDWGNEWIKEGRKCGGIPASWTHSEWHAWELGRDSSSSSSLTGEFHIQREKEGERERESPTTIGSNSFLECWFWAG